MRPVRFQTAPTGLGKNIKLPIYFLKLHETAPTGPGEISNYRNIY